jgi:uncharacterized phage-associated protein
MTYDERKAAQAAAFLLHRAGGRLPLIKLMKLMYLAERLSFDRYGEPLTGDRLVSMDNGPVLSTTYDHMGGGRQSVEHGWESWVSDRANHFLALKDPSMIRTPEQDLLELSDSDVEVLDAVWGEFGHWDRWDLVRHTHTLPEWSHPNGSSIGIDYEELFTLIGYSADEAEQLEQRMIQSRRVASQFA